MNIDFSKVTAIGGRIILKLRKASPELMLAGGIAMVVGAGVWACVNTFKKTPEVIEETHEKLDEVNATFADETAIKRQSFKVYIHQTYEMAKVYAGPVALGALGLALIVGSHHVLNRRYLGVTAAYKAVDEAYKKYRDRVKDIVGEEEEKKIYLGTSEEEVTVKKQDPNNEDNTLISSEKGVVINPKLNCSQYARFFDETSTQWKKSPEYNKTFLICQQNYANDILRSQGHLFLNEVYDMLGLERSKAGAVVGWLKDEGDGYVDFGMFDGFDSSRRSEGVRDFINGYERSILLDFNVTGVIWDKI